jgi:hypothetical protein
MVLAVEVVVQVLQEVPAELAVVRDVQVHMRLNKQRTIQLI